MKMASSHRSLLCPVIVSAVTSAVLVGRPSDVRAEKTEPPCGCVIDRFDIADRGSEWFTGDNIDFRGHLRPSFGLTVSYADKPLAIYNEDGTTRKTIVGTQVVNHLSHATVFWDRLRVGFNLPIAVFQKGEDGGFIGKINYRPATKPAIGDLRLAADLMVVGPTIDEKTDIEKELNKVREEKGFRLAIGSRVSLPTGNIDQYTGNGSVRIQPHVMVAANWGKFAFATRLATVFAPSLGWKPTLVPFGLSFGLRLFSKKVLVGPEIYGATATRKDTAFTDVATPVEALLAVHYNPLPELKLSAGAGPGSGAYGSPRVRVVVGVEWRMKLPKIRFERITYDPEKADGDGDGVPDKWDACPKEKGVKSEVASLNGCPPPPPPPDIDKDGIPDKDDACPKEPGVKTDDPKTNGCPPPPPDADGDGIPDKSDACPAEAGVKTDDPKTNGCPPPPPDTDGDGIPDKQDACPDKKGVPDADPTKNGCPVVVETDSELKHMRNVKFKHARADIADEKDPVLEAVFAILIKNPEMKLRIEGHTDSTGQAAVNRKLSQDRADAVRKWLINKGIAKARLSSKGFGPDKPIADNTTEDGRSQNRRVDFVIIK